MTAPAHPEHDQPQILTTAEQAWRFLEREGGLDPTFYDAPIVAELRSGLGLPPDVSVAEALSRVAISIEDFLDAFFKVVAPYAEMMTDLFNLFTRAGARRSDHNLRLDFDFGREDLKFGFDLQQFRDWLAAWERVSTVATVAQWDYHALWDLYRVLHVERPARQGDSDLMGADGTGAETWVREYMAGRWPRIILQPPESGSPELDRALGRAWQLWSSVVRESARISRDRGHLRELRNEPEVDAVRETEPETTWTPRFLSLVDSDHWAASVAAGLYGTAEAARRLAPGPPRQGFARQKLAALDELFARQPTALTHTQSWQQVLREFLNLPLWQRRYELYAAWVWTQILAALHQFTCRIHQEDGTIHFSFAGSHLATFPRLDPELHVWAELRSPLTEEPWGEGRKDNIQPDYTLLHDPITGRGSTVLVVECKQYRSASTQNFIAALVDYAHGRPDAVIVLVNYGPAPQRILDASPAELRGRLVLIGDMRPRGSGVAPFHETVRAVAARRFPGGETARDLDGLVAPAPSFDKIVLAWGDHPRDLDLHLVVQQQGQPEIMVFYGSRGSLSQAPWAEIDTDDRQGSGTETITIFRLSGRYRCYVHNFSNEAPFAGSGATIEIVQRGGSLKLTCPASGSGRFWQVFDLDTATGTLDLINALGETNLP